MYELMLKFKESRIGCHIGSTFCGALGCPDNVSMLSPTLSSLKVMLSIADDFSKHFNVSFNALKYQLSVYCNNDNQIEGLEHNGIFIIALMNHLGNLAGLKLIDDAVSYVTDNFCIVCNSILNSLSKLSCTVRYKLYKTYSMPLYDFLQWDLSGHYVEKFYKQWKKCVL